VSAGHVAIDALVALSVAVAVLCAVGVLVTREPLDRLHYVTPVAAVSTAVLATAVVLHESFNARGLKAVLVAVTFIVLAPVLTQATARAVRVHRFGDWTIRPDEKKKS